MSGRLRSSAVPVPLGSLEAGRVPVPAQVRGGKRHHDDVADALSDLLVATGADVLLASLERLDALQLGGLARDRVVDELLAPG